MKHNMKFLPRRKFIHQTALAGAGLMLANPSRRSPSKIAQD